MLPLLSQNDFGNTPENYFDIITLNGGVLVHLLSTANITTFDQYADDVVIPHILKQLERCTRVDIVWDTYVFDSIKASTREKRGRGIRRKVAGKNKVPGKWNDFLKDDNNKKELFDFLSGKLSSFEHPVEKEVYVTSGTEVLSKGTDQQMHTCNHEEADTRLLVHIVDAIQKGHSNCLIRTVDTDIIVILEQPSPTGTSIPSAPCWVKRNLQHCQSSTATQSVIPHQAFMERGKKLRGKLGSPFLTL